MMTYQEWLKIVEGSEAMRTVGKRFGLDDMMLRKGIEALMPAAFASAFPSMPSFGQSSFEFPSMAAFGQKGPNPFQAMFETSEAKDAIVRQAEMMSGVNKSVLEDMMPALATEMVCCSMASWIATRSSGRILSNSSMHTTPPSASTMAPPSR